MIRKSLFKKVDGIIVHTFDDSRGVAVALATAKHKQEPFHVIDLSDKEFNEVKDYELKKLWPHRTIRGSYATQESLLKEMSVRGFHLQNAGLKQKWVRNKPALVTETEAGGKSYN